MNRLDVRLVLSHLLVAVLGAAATFVIVRQLAPALFDESMRMSGMGGMGGGQGAGTLRQQFADAVQGALLVGALVGAVAAAVFGTFAAYRLVRPLAAVRAATREMAQGRYAVPVPVPHETELAELATDVNTLGRGLAETEARRVRLLGEVAHEMRTPLTVIDGYVEAMIDGVMPPGAAELSRVSDEVRRLRRLSDDLSALSRAEEGRLGLELRQVDLGSITRAAAERLRPQAEDSGLRLVVDTGTSPAGVAADADRISQVVTNMLGNAIRATPPGGELQVRCRAEHADAIVEVTDTGEGLDVADLERVFERFYRVPRRRAVEGDTGSGIGLTVARGIMRAHGGDLTAQSPGRGLGATFTARLPLSGLPGQSR
ncbi:histidine kinase [Humibacillus xanthopallidus]|uniref:histidine kinase n=1 Tax=Humibacillus xanthopallidus TaxID=412689 RepID=A0A543PR73_9MICO|nr:HAMP domain-containing sensor histidine kinase [Humibacillus xanthopallidus]TQN46580.1 histidine kinase [Humibacillus xanthopallidus]